jgi:hypothetical protein
MLTGRTLKLPDLGLHVNGWPSTLSVRSLDRTVPPSLETVGHAASWATAPEGLVSAAGRRLRLTQHRPSAGYRPASDRLSSGSHDEAQSLTTFLVDEVAKCNEYRMFAAGATSMVL